jgi:asparagine synthase (glutamine-hydrolysing)
VCGIVGSVSRRGCESPPRTLVEQAVGALRHRGPDEAGVHTAGCVSLGHTRLSIIDLAHGSQPMTNEDETIVMVYNGEIWNFKELRRDLLAAGHQFRTQSDTEVVVHAYEQWGDDFVSRLHGMYAFALWDAQRERLVLARDRLGKKPLYYANTKNGLVFGSDARSVLLVAGLEPELNRETVAHFLFQRYVNAPRTLFAGVHKLPPAHTLVFDRERVEMSAYWSIPSEEAEDLAPEELRHMLRSAVAERLMSDVPLGILLSGGVDSSAILGLMRESGADSVASFTIGFADKVYDERPLARLAADRFGSDHYEVEVSAADFVAALPRLAWFRDEPIAEPSEIPLYLLADFAGRHVKVAFSGEGGDELFGGYPKYRAEALLRGRAFPRSLMSAGMRVASRRRTHRRLDRAVETVAISDPLLRWASWFRSFSAGDLHRVLTPSLRAAADAGALTRPLRGLLGPYDDLDAGRRMLVGDLLTYLPDNMLARGDKVLMGGSIEGRMPLLDYRLVERVCRVPAQRRSGLLRGKSVLRRAVVDLLPNELQRQPKRGFPVPLSRLLFVDSPGLVGVLLSDRCLDRGVFDRAEVRRLVAGDGESPEQRDLKLFTLLSLELWLRANVDELRLEPPESLSDLADASAIEEARQAVV